MGVKVLVDGASQGRYGVVVGEGGELEVKCEA